MASPSSTQAVTRCSRASPCFYAGQRRYYTPPSRRTWAKQHHRIRTPRPMVDRFDLAREHPEKEWWRERRVAPATFFGFPDVTKAGLRGGSLYVEQMDSVTLAVLADKCVKEQVLDPEIWSKFSWRAQQIASTTHEPDLCYIFRAFARADWFDMSLLTTYLGRLHRRLFMFQLPDVAVLLEAFANKRFRQSNYMQRALTHLTLLLQHRDDASPEDLARVCAALRALKPLPNQVSRDVRAALELLAEALLLRDLGELGAGRAVKIIDCFVAWGLTSRERMGRSNAATDLCWALVRELKGTLRARGQEEPDDLATLALAMAAGGIEHDEVWEELVHNLGHEAHRLSGASAAAAAFAIARADRFTRALYDGLERRLRDRRSELSPLDCARAAGGFLRGPRAVAERTVLDGPIFDRVLELGLDAFDTEALTLLLDALARAPPRARGVEIMAGAALEAMHTNNRLGEFSARQLASVARSLGELRPEVQDVLVAVLDRACEAAADAAAEEATEAVEDPGDDDAAATAAATAMVGTIRPGHLAMLCKGIAIQPKALLPDAAERLEALLPQVQAALTKGAAATTAASLVKSLARCLAKPARNEALDACAKCLLVKACDLPAYPLVILTEDLAVFVEQRSGPGSVWEPPAKLHQELTRLLDMKRYDIGPGVLWRAASALQRINADATPQLRLEERDQPRRAE